MASKAFLNIPKEKQDREALRKILLRSKGSRSIKVAYEAGCFGYWLHDPLVRRV